MEIKTKSYKKINEENWQLSHKLQQDKGFSFDNCLIVKEVVEIPYINSPKAKNYDF